MNLTQFINTYNGTKVGTGQCVALIKQYEEDVLGLTATAVGNAHEYYDNYSNTPFLYNNFYRFTYNGSNTPIPGDVVVWNTNAGGGNGHIAIAHENITTTNFKSFDQNWNTPLKCNIETHSYNNVSGWLRLKNTPLPTTGWIAEDRYLNQAEQENNANIVINYYRSIGLSDSTIAGILGNMQAESTLSPVLTERGGGGGYGLVQWTPQSVLINHCSTLGLSPYTSGDIQLQVIIQEIIGSQSVREWYTSQGFISNYYNSGATPDMVGITGNDFLYNTMNWRPDKLAILFMAGYERPSYSPDVNHYTARQTNALNWFNYMSGYIPPTPIDQDKNKFNFVLFNKRRRCIVSG